MPMASPNFTGVLSKFAIALALLIVASLACPGADSGVHHRLMFFEYGKGPNRLVELDARGKVVWEHKPDRKSVV